MILAGLLHHDLPLWWRKGCRYFLALAWFLGLLFGVILSFSTGDSMFPMMRMAVDGSVSIVSLLVVILLPFLFSAFAVYISQPGLLLAIGFLKTFLFSFVSMQTLRGFGSAGWLIRILLLFSDGCSLPVLYWFCQEFVCGEGNDAVRRFIAACAVVFMAVGLDHLYISPFLARLFEF